jgi:hypothetical protein
MEALAMPTMRKSGRDMPIIANLTQGYLRVLLQPWATRRLY